MLLHIRPALGCPTWETSLELVIQRRLQLLQKTRLAVPSLQEIVHFSVGRPAFQGSRWKRFLRSQEFRRHPLRAVRRRVYWRLRWALRPGTPFLLPFHGGLEIQLAHSSASCGIYLNGGFSDPSIAKLFLDYLRPGMVACDCGAHIGEYTLLFSRLVGEGGCVHAFEPDPRVHAILGANIARNQLSNVVLNRVALSSQEGVAPYRLQQDATTSSLCRFAEKDGIGEIPVETTTLDRYLLSGGAARVDALKIDVEGAEAAVVEGARRVLSDFQPGLLFVECDRHENMGSVSAALRSAGYAVEARCDSLHSHPHLVARKTRSEPAGA